MFLPAEVSTDDLFYLQNEVWRDFILASWDFFFVCFVVFFFLTETHL